MARTCIEDLSESIDVRRLRPLDDMAIIKIVRREKTAGGIFLLKAKDTELCVGEIVALGKGPVSGVNGRRYPFELSVGDLVFTMGYIGERMILRDTEYRFVRDHGIWARATLKDASSLDFASIEPRFGNIVVEPREEETTLSGRIILPNGNKDSEGRLAKVVSVGPGIWNPETGGRVPVQIRPGEDVIIVRYAGANVLLNGRRLRILNETDVRCITEGV